MVENTLTPILLIGYDQKVLDDVACTFKAANFKTKQAIPG